MSKLLRQLRKHFQKNSTVPDHRCHRATHATELQNPKHVAKGLGLINYSILLILAALLLLTVHIDSANVSMLSKEVTCGRVSSTTRIVGWLETQREVEKTCVDNDSKSDIKHGEN